MVEETKNSVVILGCGDIGRRVAALCHAQGKAVSALVRSPASVAYLRGLGIAAVAGDLDDAVSLPNLSIGQALVYYFAPPPVGGRDDPRMKNWLSAVQKTAQRPRALVYISTSGVYGDTGGAWVSETTPPMPQTARAEARWDAEQRLLEWGRNSGARVVILRVGGVYGPGRLPVERIRQGQPVLRPEDCGYTNRIHADDLARICLAAGERGQVGAVYNVSDGDPGTMTQYFYAVADLYGLPRPPAIPMAQARQVLSPAMLSYLTESRRMDTRRIRDELGVSLLYPTLASGLAASKE